MAKFMSIGYTLSDLIKATTVNAAQALGLADEFGAIAVGRDARSPGKPGQKGRASPSNMG
jgi:predicted amidohydrolase